MSTTAIIITIVVIILFIIGIILLIYFLRKRNVIPTPTPTPTPPGPTPPGPTPGPPGLPQTCVVQSGNIVCPSFLSSTPAALTNGCHAGAVMEANGNFTIYPTDANNSSNGRPALWTTGSMGRGVPPYQYLIQTDGALSVYDSLGMNIWTNGVYGPDLGPYTATMQDDCNFVISSKNGILWSTNTAGG